MVQSPNGSLTRTVVTFGAGMVVFQLQSQQKTRRSKNPCLKNLLSALTFLTADGPGSADTSSDSASSSVSKRQRPRVAFRRLALCVNWVLRDLRPEKNISRLERSQARCYLRHEGTTRTYKDVAAGTAGNELGNQG